MSEQNLELILTRTLFLKEGQISSEIVLEDEHGDNMYFTFMLKYIEPDQSGKTTITIKDKNHADLVIETRPFAFTKFSRLLEIGTYRGKKLFLNVSVQACLTLEEGHNTTISFYIEK